MSSTTSTEIGRVYTNIVPFHRWPEHLRHDDNVSSVHAVEYSPDGIMRPIGFVYRTNTERGWHAATRDGVYTTVDGDFIFTSTMRHAARLLAYDYRSREVTA